MCKDPRWKSDSLTVIETPGVDSNKVRMLNGEHNVTHQCTDSVMNAKSWWQEECASGGPRFERLVWQLIEGLLKKCDSYLLWGAQIINIISCKYLDFAKLVKWIHRNDFVIFEYFSVLCSLLAFINEGICNSLGRLIWEGKKVQVKSEKLHAGRDLNPIPAGCSQKPAISSQNFAWPRFSVFCVPNSARHPNFNYSQYYQLTYGSDYSARSKRVSMLLMLLWHQLLFTRVET